MIQSRCCPENSIRRSPTYMLQSRIKMHDADHGHTAAELIVERSDHTKEHMGLTTRADVPDDKVLCYLLERQLQEISTNISVKFEIEVWYNRESLGQDLKKGEEL